MKKTVKVLMLLFMCALVIALFSAKPVQAENNSKTGVFEVNGSWYYMVNGECQYDYTGLADNKYGTWYVKNGIVDFSQTGVIQIKNDWCYIVNGAFKGNYTGIASNKYGSWYVKNGIVDFSQTGVIQIKNDWCYIVNGEFKKNYVGIASNKYGDWYVKNGIVDFSQTGVIQIKDDWCYIVNGEFKKNYTGIASNKYGDWYMKNGKVDFSQNGVIQIKNDWYYVVNGQLRTDYTGVQENKYGLWYIQNGKVDFSYSGEIVTDTMKYTIQNGKVTSSTPVEDETDKEVESKIDMKLLFTMGDSWGTGMVYNITVQNLSGDAVSDWVATVNVPSGTVLNDYWNCDCSISGTTMVIKGKYVNSDYDTSVVPANGSVEGLGISINTSQTNPIGDYVITVGDTSIPGSGEQGGSSDTQEPEEPEEPVIAEKGSAVANHGQLSVSGTQLVDKNGDPYRLCGVSTHGLAWFPQYVNKDTFQYFRDDWGTNVIRLAMYTDEYGGYLNGGNQAQLESYIDNGVKYATELGMYVIIDWHILATNPSRYTDQAKAFFEKMASKYANYDNVIYEICNEPTGSDWNSVIKPYAEKVIDSIRKYDSDAVILVGTNTWSQDVDAVVGNKIDDKNVMYVAHFYAATHGESYRNKVIKAIEGGVPVFISECSVCEASGNGGVGEDSANAWFAMLKKYNISYVAWNISNKAESSALISSSCNKLSGFTEAELSVTGKWFRNRIRTDRGLN